MSFNPTASILVMWTALACAVPSAYAQIVIPPANQGYFIQYDRFYASVTAPDDTVIGDVASEGPAIVNSVPIFLQNSVRTSWDDSDFSGGDRIDFGYVTPEFGWICSVLTFRHDHSISGGGGTVLFDDPNGLLRGFQDSNGDGFDDDVNNNNTYGRSGEDLGTPDGSMPPMFGAPFDGQPDQPAPTDFGDLVQFIPTFTSLSVVNEIRMDGVELMRAFRHPESNALSVLDLYAGVRFLKIKDRFALDGSGSVLGDTEIATTVDNNLIGPQIGLRWARIWGNLTLVAEGRVLGAVNLQQVSQSGRYTGSLSSGGGVNGPANLFPNSISNGFSKEEFSPLGELRLEALLHFNRYVAFRLGYTGMYMGGISRAAPKIEYRLPDFGVTDRSSVESVVTNAITIGLSINR
jgi:hypothetical protein